MFCESQGEYWNCVHKCLPNFGEVVMNEKLLVVGCLELGVEANVVNCIIEEAKWVAWKRRCNIRYDEIWMNDSQMVEMLKSRLKNRIEILAKSGKWSKKFKNEIQLLTQSLQKL